MTHRSTDHDAQACRDQQLAALRDLRDYARGAYDVKLVFLEVGFNDEESFQMLLQFIEDMRLDDETA